MPKITKRLVDTLKPEAAGTEAFVWDSELRGFGVRVMPSGVGSYILKYRNVDGRQRKLALARVGAVTPDEARGLARKHLAEIVQGSDPSATRKARRQAMCVSELCDLYLEDAKDRIKASTWAMDRSRIDVHVRPLLGSRSVLALTSDDVERMQSDIAAGKTAKPRTGRGGSTTGGRGVASRTVGMLGTILEFGRRKKIVKENVARGVERFPDGRQTRFLNEDELVRLGAVMWKFEQEGNRPVGLAAVRFLLLTGCRRMEALSLPLSWIDARHHCLRLGDTKSVRARESGTRIEIRPIGRPALALLENVTRPFGSKWAFPSERGDGHFVGLPNVLDSLCSEAALEGVTLHVLRHSFAAIAAGIGYSELTIAGLLGHRVQGITARYAHVPDKALVAAADAVSHRIDTLLRQSRAGT